MWVINALAVCYIVHKRIKMGLPFLKFWVSIHVHISSSSTDHRDCLRCHKGLLIMNKPTFCHFAFAKIRTIIFLGDVKNSTRKVDPPPPTVLIIKHQGITDVQRELKMQLNFQHIRKILRPVLWQWRISHIIFYWSRPHKLNFTLWSTKVGIQTRESCLFPFIVAYLAPWQWPPSPHPFFLNVTLSLWLSLHLFITISDRVRGEFNDLMLTAKWVLGKRATIWPADLLASALRGACLNVRLSPGMAHKRPEECWGLGLIASAEGITWSFITLMSHVTLFTKKKKETLSSPVDASHDHDAKLC